MELREGQSISPAFAEAARHLGPATDAEVRAFAGRQSASLERFAALDRFYAANDCRMARLHRLVSAVVVLNRFHGMSEAFAQIGALLHPVGADGAPRGPRWEAFARACRLDRAMDVRDELWIAAQATDLLEVRRQGLEAQFEREAAAHPDHPTWRLMRRHVAFTIGARRLDATALAGEVALETAIADAIGRSVSRMLRDGGATFVRTFGLGIRALVAEREYRPVARRVLRGALGAWRTVGVWQKGLREAGRGEAAATVRWPILAQVLGEEVVQQVHPEIVAFYENPAHYDVQCILDLYTVPAHVWSRLLTILAGQGLYEAGSRTHAARIRTYRRTDGSMHFVREIDTGEALRVFDSDFVVREHRGVQRLFERFPDVNLEYELVVSALGPGRGVSVRGNDLYWRGLRLPSTGLQVEFTSEVEQGPNGVVLKLDGVLAMRPRTALGRVFAYRVLRRPELLGRLRYVAVPHLPEPGECPWPFLA